jgi:hypothetical protein
VIESTPSRRIGKTAPEKTAASSGTRFRSRTAARVFSVVTWPDVVRILHADEARDFVMGRYRAAGFTPDDFGHKRPAREAMADALTRAEDRLGLAPSSPARDAIRDVRRRLEWDLYP